MILHCSIFYHNRGTNLLPAAAHPSWCSLPFVLRCCKDRFNLFPMYFPACRHTQMVYHFLNYPHRSVARWQSQVACLLEQMRNRVSTDPRAHTYRRAPLASLAAPANPLAHGRLAEIKAKFGASGSCTFLPIPIALARIARRPGQTVRLQPSFWAGMSSGWCLCRLCIGLCPGKRAYGHPRGAGMWMPVL